MALPFYNEKVANIPPQQTHNGGASITLGWCASVGRDRLGEGLLAFSARHGEIDIGVHEMAPGELVAALRRRELDVIVLPGASHPEFASRLLWFEPVRIALGLGHPLAAELELDRAALQGLSFLVPQDDGRGAVHRLLLGQIGPMAAPSAMRTARADQIESAIASGSEAAIFCGEWPGAASRIVIKPLAHPLDRIALHAHWPSHSSSAALDALVSLLAEA